MIAIRIMTLADLELGLRLRQQAGWNQTPADWARFLRLQPDGCFVAERDGMACATVTTCVFGRIGWVGMMLVDSSQRRQGIGRALMNHAIAFLESKAVRTIRLDATPLGEPLYRSLGFVEQFSVGRFAGTPAPGEPVAGIEHGQREHWESACRLDQAVTETERRRLLLALFQERPGVVRVVLRGGAVVGYLTARPGRRAWQVGPCIATAEAGPALLNDALNRFARRDIFVDAPLTHEAAVDLLKRRGLCQQRTLLRMVRGEVVVERVPQMWASSGPAQG